MFKKTTITNDDGERGQVGIGTLIVFIALVLVAAIAAGVLINTAGFLQSQAEQTGQESTEQVSNGIQVNSITTVVDQPSSGIGVLELRVGLAPGSSSVDLTEATIQWVGESNSETISIDSGGSPTTAYSASGTTVTATSNAEIPNDQNAVLNNPEDRTTIVIVGDVAGVSLDNGDQLPDDLPLTSGDEATITITTQDGAQTTAEIDVPRVLSSGEGLSL